MTLRPRRSVLFVPGSNARAMDKAASLPADAVILDLEDAVSPEAKRAARQDVCARVAARAFGARETVIRVNAPDTPWRADDMRAAIAARPDAILIPKTMDGLTIRDANAALADAADEIRLWAMIETPAGVLNADAVAAAGGRLACFVFGANDLLHAMRANPMPDRANLQAAMGMVVMAARMRGLGVLDATHNDIADTDGFARVCRQGRDFGFDGKTLIHPSQIEACNAIFSPSADEIARARRIIAAFEAPENRGKGAILVDGAMVERLHADAARRVLALGAA